MQSCRRVALLVVMFSALALSSGVATAHFLGSDSVDGRTMHYEDQTQWNDSLTNAVNAWNAVTTTGGVNVTPDTAFSGADVEVGDYTNNDGQCGYWQNRTVRVDIIRLNNQFYNGYTTLNRRACTLHEFGHAHRLAHSFSTEAMDACPVTACGTAYQTPQTHDRADYRQQWP